MASKSRLAGCVHVKMNVTPLLLSVFCFFQLGSLSAEETVPVVLFADDGSFGKGVPRSQELLSKQKGFSLQTLSAAQIRAEPWEKKARAILFTGGSGSKQSKALGEEGLKKVRSFVEQGGGYIGICAGAYLACEGFSWGLKVLDAKTVSSKWKRGVGDVKLEFTPLGQQILGFPAGTLLNIRYANGPIYTAAQAESLPDFQPLAFFRTELAENGTPAGAMVNAPAMVSGQFGKGRVLCSSPHPEQTVGMELWLEHAVRWAAGVSK
jgi:glutamine amidotransferase-like uncharacterized protein